MTSPTDRHAAIRRFVDQAHAALEQVDYYRILGVSSASDGAKIQKAYYKLAARLHPDLFGVDAEPAFRLKLTTVFSRVVEAYKVLSDPDKRSSYDRGLARGQLRYQIGAEIGEQKPEDSISDPGARKFYVLAKAALDSGDRKSAVMNLRLALSMDPDNELIKTELDAAEKG